MSILDHRLPDVALAPDRMTILVPADQVARGQPAIVTVAVTCGGRADLPDDEWFAAFGQTEGSLADLDFQRPIQPILDVIPATDW